MSLVLRLLFSVFVYIKRKVNVKPRTNIKPFYTFSFMYILSRREKTSHTYVIISLKQKEIRKATAQFQTPSLAK